MADFIIAGTSGVGKTHLEEVLEQEYDFYQLIKYMDREPRPGEIDNPKVGFVTKEQFQRQFNNGEFIFTLEYAGKNYGWRKDDYDAHAKRNRTMGVTLESLKDFPSKIPQFIPVMLHLDIENIDLIKKRIEKREFSDDMTEEEIASVEAKIEKRLDLAKEEYERHEEYKTIVEDNNGKVFSVKSDDTIHEEVIPWILNKV